MQTGNPPSSEGGVSKKVATSSDKFPMKGMQLLTKLCPKNAMGVRDLQAATLLTIQMPKDCDFIANVIAATRNYNDEQFKAKSSGGQALVGQHIATHGLRYLRRCCSYNRGAGSSAKACSCPLWQSSSGGRGCSCLPRQKCFDQSKM